ncbi:helix-turn-helix domain-containing protein [Chitinophaga varians]|uniref:helix-turn-helix domain-containing protein n=1 Tax=Chitinophaga varians TaxID=2202339 RepID=UPI00165F61F0|nr:AraC family transcriptional regulator [Chitinophaga varians]MBC9911704.1 helix-turn-helix transcriptional regulator [Chitinophaga varians]
MKDHALSILRHRTHQPAARAQITLQQNMFTFLLEGEKTVHFAGTQVTVKPHQFIMLAAGNCLMSEKLASKEAAYHAILLLFEGKLLSDFFDRHPSLSGQSTQTSAEPFVLFEKDEFLVSFIHSLDCMLRSGQAIHPDLRKVKLEELFLYLAIHSPEQMQRMRNMHTEAGEDLMIRQAVTSHMDHSITVEELAFLCNMSLSSFKRKFARMYGNSPNRWLLEKRMERAATMLRQDNRKASEIYYELGYENLSSFIQSFKQIYGITPKQYQLSN